MNKNDQQKAEGKAQVYSIETLSELAKTKLVHGIPVDGAAALKLLRNNMFQRHSEAAQRIEDIIKSIEPIISKINLGEQSGNTSAVQQQPELPTTVKPVPTMDQLLKEHTPEEALIILKDEIAEVDKNLDTLEKSKIEKGKEINHIQAGIELLQRNSITIIALGVEFERLSNKGFNVYLTSKFVDFSINVAFLLFEIWFSYVVATKLDPQLLDYFTFDATFLICFIIAFFVFNPLTRKLNTSIYWYFFNKFLERLKPSVENFEKTLIEIRNKVKELEQHFEQDKLKN